MGKMDEKKLLDMIRWVEAEREKELVPQSILGIGYCDAEFVVESNAIEGYEGEQYGPRSPHYSGHMAAWKHIREALVEGDLTPDVLLETHRLLMEGIDSKIAGVFRSYNVRVGNYICPAWAKVPGLLGVVYSLAKKAKTADDCWAVHHAFESVHPFADGNGRTGRCILNAMLVKLGLQPVVVLSALRHDYYKLIEKWRKENQHLFLTG